MQRLLADAQKITGIKYDINNLSDVYEAIHVIQGELGITGTTALEANETLEGSFKSLKASYKDFLGKLLLGEDLSKPMSNLATSVINVAKNVLPAVSNIVSGILPAITGALAQLAPQLPPMLVDFVISALSGLAASLPQTFENITLIMTGLLDGILAALPVLINALPEIITTLVNATLGFIPQLVECGVTLFTSLIDNLPLIIETIVLAAPQIINQVVNAILSNLPLIITAGVTLFTALVRALPQIIVQIVKAVPQIITGLKNSFMNFVSEFPSIGSNIIGAIGNGIVDALGGLVETGIKACKKLAKSVKDFFGIKSPSRMFRDFGSYMMKGLAIGIEKTSSLPAQAMDKANQQILKDFDSNLSREIAFSSSFKGSSDKHFNGKTSPNITQTFIFNEPWQSPADTARALRTESIKLGLAGDIIG